MSKFALYANIKIMSYCLHLHSEIVWIADCEHALLIKVQACHARIGKRRYKASQALKRRHTHLHKTKKLPKLSFPQCIIHIRCTWASFMSAKKAKLSAMLSAKSWRLFTHRDWSQTRPTNNGVRSRRRMSWEQAHDTWVKHSAHALRTPHTPSSYR